MTYAPSHETTDHLIALALQERPDWDRGLLRLVLDDLVAKQVTGTDLAIVTLRLAADPRSLPPKAIGWRGPHWRDLDSTPPEVQPSARCQTCGKPEPRCLTERPGLDDDHAYDPPVTLVTR